MRTLTIGGVQAGSAGLGSNVADVVKLRLHIFILPSNPIPMYITGKNSCIAQKITCIVSVKKVKNRKIYTTYNPSGKLKTPKAKNTTIFS